MTDNDEVTLLNLFTLITIDDNNQNNNNQKINVRHNFDFYMIEPKSAVQQAKNYENEKTEKRKHCSVNKTKNTSKTQQQLL